MLSIHQRVIDRWPRRKGVLYCGGMQVFVFQSTLHPEYFAYTDGAGGENLPRQFGPWFPVGSRVLMMGENASHDLLLAALAETGWFLARQQMISGLSEPRRS